MLRNNDFMNYGEMPPENYNQDEIMVLFLIDNSGSMAPHMSIVNEEINKVAAELKENNMAAKMVEVAVMAFNDDTYLYQDFRPVTQMNRVNLTAGGGTELDKALTDAINLVRERGNKLEDEGLTVRIPFIFLVSDCYGGDVTSAARLVKERTDEHKLQLWTLGVGDYDKPTMATLHPDGMRLLEMKVENENDVRSAYKEFFEKVVTASVKAVSQKGAGEQTSFDNPLKNPNTKLKVPDVDAWLKN